MFRGISIVAPRTIALLERFTPIRISNMAIFPFILSREEPSELDLQHERVHIAQQLEIALLFSIAGSAMLFYTQAQALAFVLWLLFCWMPLIAPFYLLYAAMYTGILLSLFYKGATQSNHYAAYYNIPFEREAYDYEGKSRKLFGWLRYLY